MNIQEYKTRIQELEDTIEANEHLEGQVAEIADEIEKYLYEKANGLLGNGDKPFDRADEIIGRINAIID